MADPSIEAALAALGEQVDWPAEVDLAVGPRLGPTTRTPRVSWAVVALVLLALALLVPGTRRAVANLLEVAGIRFEFGTAPGLAPPTDLAPGRQVDGAAAARAVDFPIRLPSTLDPPAAIHLLEWDLGTQVFLAWEASDRLPEVGVSGTGLLLAEFRADLDEDFFTKIVAEGTRVDRVLVDGEPAFWLSGAPHVFLFETGRSDMVADGTRLTGNVLIWEAGGITYRLESGLGRAASVAIAESLEP